MVVNSVMSYFSELCRAMERLAGNPRTIFMGQAVACPGTAMYRTLANVPKTKCIELPVAEDMQLGMAIGASLNGELPICIYPRINFLLLAMSQLVLHLDKLPLYSEYKPKVIIRTAIAHDDPLNPGVQHLGDYSNALYQMLDTVFIDKLMFAEQVVPKYDNAMARNGSTLIVEYLGKYDE